MPGRASGSIPGSSTYLAGQSTESGIGPAGHRLSSFVQGFRRACGTTSTAPPQADYESASARDRVVGVGQNYINIDVTTLACLECALNLRSHGRVSDTAQEMTG